MNQILYMGSKKKKSGQLDITTVSMIFAVSIIVFGLILITVGAVSMFTNKKDENKNNATVPVVSIEKVGEEIKISVQHNKIIDKIVYSWKANQENVLQGKGRQQIEETIDLPVGNNTLKLKVIDIDGIEVAYEKDYNRVPTDTTLPEIELTVDGSKVKISAKDETQMAHILYHWNDEEDTELEVREDSLKLIEEKVSILKGENTLKVTAVDSNGNTATKEQIFKGAKKPTIELTADNVNKELIIKVVDEENILKIEYTLNGALYSTDSTSTGEALGIKEVEFRQKLQDGANTITIKAYSTNGLSEEKTTQVNV